MRDGHRQDALGVVARTDAIEVLGGAQQQRRAGEERHGEHDLDRRRRRPGAAARRGRRVVRDPLSRREAIAPRRAQRRQQPGADAGRERGEGAEEQDRPADGDGVGPRDGVTADGAQHRDDRRRPGRRRAAAAVSAIATASISTSRNSRARPAPIAARVAYSCWRCRPRASSRPLTLAQAMRNSRPTAPNSGTSSRSPSRVQHGAHRAGGRGEAGEPRDRPWRCRPTSPRARPARRAAVAPGFSRAMTLPAPRSTAVSSAVIASQKSTLASRS